MNEETTKPSDESVSGALRFQIDGFEGPLDILLHLVKKNRYDILEIPIVEIAGQYLRMIEVMDEMNLKIAGEFLVMAATLAHLKSKALLPPNDAEEENEDDLSLEELQEMLLQYERYKSASQRLREMAEERSRVWFRPSADSEESTEIHWALDADLYQLASACMEALSRLPKGEQEKRIVVTRHTLSVQEQMTSILKRLAVTPLVRWRVLVSGCQRKREIIAMFLALLELTRTGMTRLRPVPGFVDFEIIVRR